MKFLDKILNEKKYIIDVINISGSITYFAKNNINANCCNAKEITSIIRDIIDDKSNQHIVIFRINSPGGTAAAGEEIANMINKLNIEKIYNIASVGDVACSAAYLIASQCNYIFANRFSLLGSIGVLMPIPNISNLSEKVGITVNFLKSGKMKDIGNMFRDMTDDEKQYIESILQRSHHQFIDFVKYKRNITNSDIFDGRFVDAECALENHLIDDYGSFDDALLFVLNQFKLTRSQVTIHDHIKKASWLQKVLSIG